jgi:hypothetical protein
MYNAPYQGVANQLSQYGRFGDSQLVHMNPIEVQMLASLSPTGQLTRNPQTGQPEAFLPFLAPLLGSFLGKAALGSTLTGVLGSKALGAAAAGALGSAAATTAVTGDLEQGIMSGITGFGIGSALGGLGDLAKGAGSVAEATTQGVQAVPELSSALQSMPQNLGSMANAPIEQFANLPIDQLNLNVPEIGVDALSSGMQAAPSLGQMGGASLEQFANMQPPPPTFMESLAQPFQQPGEFIGQLAKPSSFLPIYVGETGRMAREQAIAGQGSARAFEEEQEKERARIRGQMGDVFGSIRQAYPGVGYAQGGRVERYFDGGYFESEAERAARDALYNASIPAAQDVQLSLRGQYALTPPAASYSALDVGGEGYMPGMAPEFRYFTDVDPNAPVTSPVNPPEGPPAGPGMDMGGLEYGGFDLNQFLSQFGAYQGYFGGGAGGVPSDVGAASVAGRESNFADDLSYMGEPADFLSQYMPETPSFTRSEPEYMGGMASDIGSMEPSREPQMDFGNMPQFDLSEFQSRFGNLAGMPSVSQPPIPELPPDLQSGIGALPSGFEMPQAAMPEMPQAPQFEMPQPPMQQAPQFEMPQIEMPRGETIRQPPTFQAPMPQPPMQQAPQFEAPQFAMPQFEMPQFEMPQAPQVQAPQIQAPQFEAPQVRRPREPEFDIRSRLMAELGSLNLPQRMPEPSVNLPVPSNRLSSFSQRAPDVYAERLMALENLLSGRGSLVDDDMMFNQSLMFAEGGMTPPPEQAAGTDSDLVTMTVAAIRGEVDNADQIIRAFVEQYGPEVFMQLREQVLQSIVPGAQTEGMVQGNGGGQDDLVEGMIGTQRPVAVSPGEYIIPADVVSLAGGGYSGDGANFFDGLVDDIRQKTMGTTEQVRPYRRSV